MDFLVNHLVTAIKKREETQLRLGTSRLFYLSFNFYQPPLTKEAQAKKRATQVTVYSHSFLHWRGKVMLRLVIKNDSGWSDEMEKEEVVEVVMVW